MAPRLALLSLLAAAAPALAQQPYAPDSVGAARYAHAEKFLAQNTTPLVTGTVTRPTWLPTGQVWYRTRVPEGEDFVVVAPRRRSRTRAFDQVAMAAALSSASGQKVAAYHLPLVEMALPATGQTATFVVHGKRYRCSIHEAHCEPADTAGRAGLRDAVVSPDGQKAAFIRDWNLWVRDLDSGKETRLTQDGVKDYGYATDNAGWTHSDRPILLWSPDSRKIATFQQDQRRVGMMYLVHTQLGHPTLDAWHYPLPGDSVVAMIHRVIIDVADPQGPRLIRLRMPPDQHRSTVCDDVACRGVGFTDVEWSPDASRLFFVSTSRDHKDETLREADAATGRVRDILKETVPDFFESGYHMADWRVLPASNQVIWFSERDNWGHLYLYDLATGKLEHRITSGDWPVLQVLRVDPKTHTIFFVGAGREPGDPYFRHFYSIRMDGTRLRLLTPDSADHEVSLSPDGKTFVDTYSTPTTPPSSVLRDASSGKVLVKLEKGDISRLLTAGWKPPIPFTVKARDGKTDLYGLLFRPTNLDPSKKYPIVNHIYPGPQTGSVGTRQFLPSRGDAQALAELGFVVVELDAMGTPLRSHSFHAEWYGDMGDNGLPDQVGAMKQLAARYPWVDLSRVGIYGHSGGGFATADAMFRYPDFFKVGIAEAGNHDNREYEDDWGEKWQGLLLTHPDGTTSYDNQANESLARNLRGKLLLAYGTTDDNVPPYNTLLVVDSLIVANKDFDLIPFPNRHHGFGNEPYMVRRRWDYFVKNLLGAEPPHEFRIEAQERRR